MCLHYKPLFDTYAARTSRPMSAYHFSSIFAWSDHFRFTFEIIEDHLCVFAFTGKDSFLYLPPLGAEFDLRVIAQCFKRMGKRPIARIENIMDNQLPALKASGYNVYQKASEYVYRNTELQALSGTAYKAKRHDVHVFSKHFQQARFREFTPEDGPGCAKLYTAWAHDRQDKETDPIYVQMLEENALVHAKLLAHADALGLVGRIVEIDGDVAGYTFGYQLNPTTFCVALEIADLSKSGIAAFIFNSFCKDAAVKDSEFINTMDDFGMPNVARAKASYNPTQVLPIYNIKENF